MVMTPTTPARKPAEAAFLIRRYRRARGLTQQALAEQAGVSAGAISYLERGLTHTPHRDTLRALVEALSLSEQETAALELALRRAAIPAPQGTDADRFAAHSGAFGISKPLTSLIGREREAAAITAMIATEDARLLTLTGPAGVGKTRLASHVAAHLREEYRRPVAFVGLTPVDDPKRALPAIAQALEIQDSGVAPLRDTLRSALEDRELVLVLDNFEQVAQAAPDVIALLEACPGVSALVTSRSALNVRGEREFPVAPLAIPAQQRPASPEDIACYASVALFLDRARAVCPDFTLDTPEDVQLMAEVAARLDGLPLAIELAAAQIRHAPLAELHRRLTSATPLNALSGGAMDLPDHQRAMRSAIAWSYRLLDLEEQRVFRTLSLFAGGASAAGVAAVAGADARHESIRAALDTLVNQNLIYIVGDGRSMRYAQLVTLRAYGLERLEESGELDLARQRHAQYYVTLAEEERPRLERCEPGSLALLSEEYENLRAALGWSLEVANAEAVWIGLRLAGAIWFWWEVRGLLAEGLRWLESLLATAPDAEDERACKVLAPVWTGVMATSYHLGRFERAYEAGERALALQRGFGDKSELAEALNNQGIVAAGLQKYEAAERYFRESLDLYGKMGHPAEECKPLMNLGGVKRDLRRYDEALALYQKSLRIAGQTEAHDEARAILWDDIGDVHILRDEPARAHMALRRAEEIFQWLDAGLGIALCVHDLGRALLAEEHLDEAARQFSLAVTMRDELGDGAGAARSRVRLARVRIAQDYLDDATHLLAHALRALTALKRSEALWAVIEGAAALTCAQGRFEDATHLYAAAIQQRDALYDIIDPREYKLRAHDLAAIRAGLGEERYAETFASGSALRLDEALDLLYDRLLLTAP
jgi:predicted ATPase/DNA-binding XRE family transcriptional regulator